MSEKDLVNEIWKHRDDPEEWSEEAEDIQVRPSRSSVVSFRLPPEELTELEAAATRSGESLSEFIRKSLALRLRQDKFASTVAAIYGTSGISSGEPDQLMMHGNLIMGNYSVAASRRLFEPQNLTPFRWWFGKNAQQRSLFSA